MKVVNSVFKKVFFIIVYCIAKLVHCDALRNKISLINFCGQGSIYTMHRINYHYGYEISQKNFAVTLRPVKFAEIFNIKNFTLYGRNNL